MGEQFSALLPASRSGDEAAFSEVYAAAYAELRRSARVQLRRLRPGCTLTTTALVHEAFVKLVRKPVGTEDRAHFLAIAARAMRQILIDHARARKTHKRRARIEPVLSGSAEGRVEAIADELLAIDAALGRLAALDGRLAQVVECRFFGGLTEAEIGEALGLDERTVRRDWRKARAFLHREIGFLPEGEGTS
jgi:RNA polymerase sigma factor (TIGR02999 family)